MRSDPARPEYSRTFVAMLLGIDAADVPPRPQAPAAPAPAARPAATELDALRVIGRCAFGRLPSCGCAGKVFCDGGRRKGETVHVAECERCPELRKRES